jgi:predicted SnoaL-like aldol condensation-catalyzing enzyme
MNKLLTLLCSICVLNTFALDNLWQNVSASRLHMPGEQKIIPLQSNKVQLNDASFRTLQLLIPSEASGQSILMQLPTPDGGYRTFKVFERVTMEKELADKYPMIKTYQAIAADDPFVTAKLDYTEFGFHAMVFSKEGIFFIDPYTNVNTGFYNCYYKKDYVRQPGQFSVCETPASDESQLLNPSNTNGQRLVNNSNNAIVTDGKIRTFRLALACTIEYSAAVASPNPTKARVLSAMVTSVNRVNGVLEKDLSFHMNLVPNNDTLIFITSDTYSNTNGSSMLGQNQTVCDARIGNANYDIGHVFSTGGGGVAFLGCVCNAGNKARGVTGSSNPVGDSYDIDYVIHEMGHQFGANHTFNAGTGSCGGNRASSSAYEPGSGTTIMAYAGICGTNDIQPHSDDYFHRASINEIYNYIAGSTACAVITNSNNTPPEIIDYTATYYIPYKTSFEITAAATDADGDPINYCWEEYDLGPEGSWDNNGIITAPIFRSILPTASPTRTFPKWDSLIKNVIKYKGEVLPETTRDVKFRCTVRDINNGYGRFNAPSGNMVLKSTITTSLFRVTSFPSASNINGNTNQTVAWDVAGTTASPISCANVDIYLSLDSARTFPYLLAGNTPNDGSESVLIPNVFTDNASARIKVKGSGNVFFDLNNGWIKINQAVVSQFSVNDSVICRGSSLTFTNSSTGSPDSVRWTINGGTPSTSTSQTTVAVTFNTAGIYTVSLTAYKAGVGSTPFSKTITVNPTVITQFSRTICQGDSVTIGNQSFTTPGNYNVHLQTSLGCDSSVYLTLTVNPTAITQFSRTICQGDSVTIGNQSFMTPGNYNVHLQTSLGCDSSVYLTLTVNPTAITQFSRTICQGDSVTIGNQSFTTPGNYNVHLQTSLGCDSSMYLTLTVNPTVITQFSRTICQGDSVTIGNQSFTTPGNYNVHLQTSLGCDSSVYLTLTVNPTAITQFSRTICQGESVTIGNQTFTTPGNYNVHLQTSLGCDSSVYLTLTVNPTAITQFSRTICQGDSVTIGNQSFMTPGNYNVHLQTSLGCDSSVYLTLTVNPTAITQFSRTICQGDSVTIGNQSFTTPGNYNVHLQTSLGCDSSVYLTLTVNPTSITQFSRTICQGESVTIGNQTFTTPGNYNVHLQTSLGCDSSVYLTLTVNPTAITQFSRTICQGDSVTIGNQTFTTPGNYNVHLQTSLGCDSSVYLTLTVNPTAITQFSRTICQGDSVTIGNQSFMTPGNYNVHLQTSLGCDSSVYLTLTVNPTAITQFSRMICLGDSVTIGNQSFTTPGNYNVHLQTSLGCDSSVYLALTVETPPAKPILDIRNDSLIATGSSAVTYKWYLNGVLQSSTDSPSFKPTQPGNWTVVAFSANNCVSETSAPFIVSGVKKNSQQVLFAVLPNPNKGQFDIQITAAKSGQYMLSLYNVAGQELRKETLNVSKGTSTLHFNADHLENGMYFISVYGEEGMVTQTVLIQ